FKARSALEGHLATKHADQYTRGEIDIDALPDSDSSDEMSNLPSGGIGNGSPNANHSSSSLLSLAGLNLSNSSQMQMFQQQQQLDELSVLSNLLAGNAPQLSGLSGLGNAMDSGNQQQQFNQSMDQG